MLQLLSGRVTIDKDVVYGNGGGRDLLCDVYHPPDAEADRPGVLIIHGGGWETGDRDQLTYYGIQLARYGCVGVACEYRLSGEAIWPAHIHDVKAALRWMRANADSLGVDARKICATGNSAGAHLALMLGCDTDEFEGDGGNMDVDSDCGAVAAIYPPTRLRLGDHGDAFRRLFGDAAEESVAAGASPMNYADRSFPPTILIHGNADEVVPCDESLNMYHALKAAGADAELHVFDGAPHAFDALPEFARTCVQLIALFFDRKVVHPRPVVVSEGV